MRWLFFITLFIAAAFFGFEVAEDPGYALFVYHGWSIQMPLWIFVLLFLIVFIFFYILARLVFSIILFKYSLRSWWSSRVFYRNQVKKT